MLHIRKFQEAIDFIVGNIIMFFYCLIQFKFKVFDHSLENGYYTLSFFYIERFMWQNFNDI